MLVIVRLFAAFTGLLAAVVAWSLLMDGQAGTPAFGMAALLAATALGLYILLGRQLTHQHAQVLALARRGRPLLVNACPGHAAFWLVTTAMGINLVVMAARHSQGKHLAITLLVAAVALGALLALAHLMWQILQPGPMLRLDRHGLVHALCGRIPWSAVEGIDLRTFHIRNMPPRHILYLRLHQPRRYLERLPWLARWLHSRELATDRPADNFRIALNPLAVPAQTIVQAARLLCLQAPNNRLLPDWRHTMSGIEVAALRQQQAASQTDSGTVPVSETGPGYGQESAAKNAAPAALRQRLREQRLDQAAKVAERRRRRRNRLASLLVVAGLFLLNLLRLQLR